MMSWEDLMSVRVPDIVAFVYLFLLILVISASCVMFTSFVKSKPDGRKTVIGNVLYLLKSFVNFIIFSQSQCVKLPSVEFLHYAFVFVYLAETLGWTFYIFWSSGCSLFYKNYNSSFCNHADI